MGRIRLYNTETGKWEWWHVETVPKQRPGRILRLVRNSFRQTWRRLVSGHADRTLYTFDPENLDMDNERRRRLRGRAARRRARFAAVAGAVISMVMIQKRIN